MKTKNLIINRIIICFLCLMVFIGSILSLNVSKASAEDSITFDDTNVLDDLRGSTIGGKVFNEADYPRDYEHGKVQLILFSEFCYSAYANNMDDFGLYVYIYNPKGLVFDLTGVNNVITIAVGANSTGDVYKLKFLNSSNEGLEVGDKFYKFKVEFIQNQRTNLLNALNSNSREYFVSELDLSIDGKMSNYSVMSTYTYRGYAKGYGESSDTESTLSCNVDGFDKYVTLDVYSTYYRPEGTNGKANTQDSLHSVYFAVDNELIREYGEMTAVTATFYDALLAPAFVTGDGSDYLDLSPYLGKPCPGWDVLSFGFIGAYSYLDYLPADGVYGELSHIVAGGFSYNANSLATDILATQAVDPLNLLFYVDGLGTLLDDYGNSCGQILSSEDIKDRLEALTILYDDTKVLNRYSEKLFERVAEERTLLKIEKDLVNGEALNLVSRTISQNWWQKLWGTGTVHTQLFNDFKAIQPVDFKDLDVLAEIELSNKYLVNLSDMTDFKGVCERANASDKTVYLLRYRVTDYRAERAYASAYSGFTPLTTTQNDSFFFQMSCDLDFQIIDLTFTKDNVDTVIPVLMAPMDVFHGATAPVSSDKDGDCTGFDLSKIIAIICFIALMWVLVKTGILGYIVDGIVWLIKAPFKLIAKLFKKDKRK